MRNYGTSIKGAAACCRHFVVQLVPLVTLLTGASHANAQSVFDRTEPFIGARYGMGYDLSAQRPATGGRSCVTFKADKVSSENDGTARTDRKYIKKSADLVKEMNLSSHAQIKSLSGTFDGSASLEMANKSEAHQFSETWLYYNERRADTQLLLTEEILIGNDYLTLLKGDAAARDEFRARCGNSFVVGLQNGSFFYGTAFKSSDSSSSTRTLNIGAKVGFTNTVKFKADFALAMKEVRSEEKLEERVSSATSDLSLPAPKSREELEAQWQTFKAQPGSGKSIAIVLSPYSVAQNAPGAGVLAKSTEDEKIDLLLEALWDLKTLKDEARYVLRHESKFALGLPSGNTRGARIADVRGHLARWTAEFDRLLVTTRTCINKYDSSCTTAANTFGSNPKIAEQRVLPKKYKSMCYGDFNVTQSEDQGSAEMVFGATGPSRGDDEMNGGPVIVDASLTIMKDGRRLKAEVKTTLQERPADYTTFNVFASTTLFDLSPTPGQEDIFEECEFADLPVNARPTLLPTTYGAIRKVTGRSPRDFIRFDGGSGLLDSISCEVDTKGRDARRLGCKAPQIRSVRVLLVNKLDREAERWRPGQ